MVRDVPNLPKEVPNGALTDRNVHMKSAGAKWAVTL
jgi:hypothetical protein